MKSAILINFIKYIFLLFLFFFLSLSIEKVVESVEFVRIRRWTTSRVIASMFARRRNESPINSYYCMSYFKLPLLRFAMCGNRINPRRQTNNLLPPIIVTSALKLIIARALRKLVGATPLRFPTNFSSKTLWIRVEE